ncbi:hypothetical protein ES332_A11G232700v1 [Gossypium tomentosum]|uniref:Uncharacterized protein n=1 Tax=Gossypium tomentosum TaxID=34277 RepID=A0A5D2NEY4_GOSTO|nr:hypothetical protein ES332_A11G232700v1 [Gossypium tomentosum]
MDQEENQQVKYPKPADILDLSVVSSADNSRVTTQIQKQIKQRAAMCEEEWRIRGELESEIERDLEEEIKDGIYHLAFRLHRLYQNKRERNADDISESAHKQKDKTLSEVNICIKMEGGTKIEIKETKKEALNDGKGQRIRPRSSRSRNGKGMLGSKSNGKKFDWAKSLRAGTDPEAMVPCNGRGFSMNRSLENTRRKLVSATGSVLRKGNIGVNNKVLELGWKW